MNLKEMLVDLKKDPEKFSELLKRIEELEEVEPVGGVKTDKPSRKTQPRQQRFSYV